MAKCLLMQEIDGTGIDFAEHALRHQLVQIMAGGIALHIKTLRQIARGKHLTDIFRIKNPFGSSGSKQGIFAHRILSRLSHQQL